MHYGIDLLSFEVFPVHLLTNIVFRSSWTNKIITSTDTGSVQINVGHVDSKTGCYNGKFTPFALCGFVRAKGDSDAALAELARGIESTSE